MGGMADIFEWPETLALTLEKDSDDELLTCLLCGSNKCNMTTTIRLGGRRTTWGLHANCVKGLD